MHAYMVLKDHTCRWVVVHFYAIFCVELHPRLCVASLVGPAMLRRVRVVRHYDALKSEEVSVVDVDVCCKRCSDPRMIANKSDEPFAWTSKAWIAGVKP